MSIFGGWSSDAAIESFRPTAHRAGLVDGERLWLEAESRRQREVEMAEDEALIARVDAWLAERHPGIWAADLSYLGQVAA